MTNPFNTVSSQVTHSKYTIRAGKKYCKITTHECPKRLPCNSCDPSKDEEIIKNELYKAIMLRIDIRACNKCDYYHEETEPRDCHTTHECHLFNTTLGFDGKFSRCPQCQEILGHQD